MSDPRVKDLLTDYVAKNHLKKTQRHEEHEQQSKGDECSEDRAPIERNAQNTNEDPLPDFVRSVEVPKAGMMAIVVLVEFGLAYQTCHLRSVQDEIEQNIHDCDQDEVKHKVDDCDRTQAPKRFVCQYYKHTTVQAGDAGDRDMPAVWLCGFAFSHSWGLALQIAARRDEPVRLALDML